MKYLFFDIDGTLVSHDHGLIPSAKKAIERSRQKGNLCFLATGRHLSSLWAVKDLDMDGVIYCNGAGIFMHGKILYTNPIPHTICSRTVFQAEERNGAYSLQSSYEMFKNVAEMDRFEKSVAFDPRFTSFQDKLQKFGAKPFTQYRSQDILKIDIGFATEEIMDDFQKVMSPQLTLVSTAGYHIEEGKKSGDYLKIGSIYCEEVHHYLYGKYDPAIQVNLCEILTKGDPLCNFRLNMREANKSAYAVPVYEPQSWEDYGTDVTGSIYTVFCLNYFHYGKAIYDTLGKNTLKNGLRAFGKCRGERIRELNRRRGQENSIENLLEQGDLFLDIRENPEVEKVSDREYRIHFSRNIMREVLRSHKAEELLDIYYEEAIAALAVAYNSKLRTEIMELPQKTGYEMKIRVEE